MSDRLGRLRAWFADKKNWKRVLLPLALIAGLFVLVRLIEVDQYLQIVREWVGTLGPWGPVAYALIYVAAMLLLLPGTPFTLLAALLFGSLWGYVTMVAATTLAAVTAFFIARYLARNAVERRFADTPTFEKLKGMVEKNHWFAIPFIRLMPIFPFAINNYALGLTRISFWSYLLTSEIVFLPMNAVLVLGAGALYRAMVKGEAAWPLIGITTAAGLLVLGLGWWGKRTFGSEEGDRGPGKPEAASGGRPPKKEPAASAPKP